MILVLCILIGRSLEKDHLELCKFNSLILIVSYRVTLNGQYYAVKVLEDNNNMLVLQREIAFQIRSQCQNIVVFYDTYLFDRKIWVFFTCCY